ncbi:uncharacterized protein AC631_02488 [Debaryomyces fabryi]|uniref:RAVE complex protein Rav1 C-terminal domain-containing protein n=1 Tax=Debaryomyces fabryi TaxID=58627 RepID=A0A0V1Q0P2_9ASCO|nr:uncharacterized protein AC631_02488 [Debaryomyces fabryi]KSA01743.1 hypothetical protein AC631_02488 [Debaryomyces fabryi]CUM51261.1 unnamed protein product [Debaryomyces fabryi]
MTINFVPGEVNNSPYSVLQGLWKSHHIIAYGSGNNLIIYTTTTDSATKNKKSDHLQTIYLEADPYAIDINSSNGLIVISIGNNIVVYKPVNEYMLKPQWTHALEFDNVDSTLISCLQWAPLEDELIVGSKESLTLYHIYDEYGSLKYEKRWNSVQSNPITNIKITNNSNKIITISGNYERLVKVWSRINYGENTLFELSYLNHPLNTYVTDLKWKFRIPSDSISTVDSSMANIKNIRGYIDNGNDDNDIIYTLTNDNILRVWAAYEFSGHSHFRSWASLDLTGCFDDDEIISIVTIDNFHLQKTLIPQIETGQGSSRIFKYFENQNLNDLDLLFVVSKKGKIAIYSILNISLTPPNAIKFERLDQSNMCFDKNSFPNGINNTKFETLTKEVIQSEEFLINLKPIIFPELEFLDNSSNSTGLSILIHDRLKNTIRFNVFDFQNILKSDSSVLGAKLINKFQGHTKSIQKLVRSNSSFSSNNILFSILNFPEHNYLWEPLLIGTSNTQSMSITKKFQINLNNGCSKTNEKSEGIWDSVLLNDVEPPNKIGRHHLVVALEKSGLISLWDCNALTLDIRNASLLERLEILSSNNERVVQEPRAFVITEFPKESCDSKEYCIIAIFENDLVRAWKLIIESNNKQPMSISLKSLSINNLPQNEKIHQIALIDSFVSKGERNLISVIDKKDRVKFFAIDFAKSRDSLEWVETYRLHTNISEASKIHGASIINKFAIVDKTGSRLTIWDTNSGVLEYEETFDESYGAVTDLDWTFITSSSEKLTSNAILSVGFLRFVLLYTQLRYDYTNKIPTFGVLKKIDISDYTSHEIGDLIWLDDGYLVIGCGNQFFIDDKWVKLGSSTNSSLDSTIRQLMVGYTNKANEENEANDEAQNKAKSTNDLVYDIEQLVRILNGPLPVYHPQFLIQCLFMSQISLVKDVLVRLFQILRKGDPIQWDLSMDLTNEVFENNESRQSGASTPSLSNKIDIINDALTSKFDSSGIHIFSSFNDNLLDLLIEKLMKTSLPLLTRHQQITLISIISIVRELEKYVIALDENGLRFLLGLKLFQLSSKQSKLTTRDISWALHSDNKEMLLTMVEAYYKNRLKWDNVKQTGLVYWVETIRLTKIIESSARNEFSDTRDPSGRVSLFYLAIRKKQVLIGLWRTVSHSEQQKMLKFLANDFNEQRWKSAALKNAYVLMGKHRYIDAAYFFLLADALKDCCNVIATKLNDVQLAIAIAKIYAATSKGTISEKEIIKNLIENYMVPEVLKNGDRWITSWIFWELEENEISIQALIKSPIEIIKQHKSKFSDDCYKYYISKITPQFSSMSFLKDDPVLVILFHALRQKTVKYLKGSLSIAPEEEFNFIIKVCSIYTRMGCDYLAVVLIRNWSFVKYDESKNEIKWSNNTPTNTNTNQLNEKQNTLSFTENGIHPESMAQKIKAQPPPPTAFEEPDMSAFDFGF